MSVQTLRVLYGPTASGKSALALDWARRHNGSIINADSLQVYDALPILTAQPSQAEKTAAPHKLYGYADPRTSMTAADWAKQAASLLTGNDILVGGTGMYIKVLREGIAPIPEISANIRPELEALYDALGPMDFHKELQAIDPQAAARVHPNRREQMIRALEVFKGTGEAFSAWHAKPRTKFLPEDIEIRLAVFLPEKSWIQKRAAERIDSMLVQGVLEEVSAFGKTHGASVPAAKALGFKSLWEHVQGTLSLEEARLQTARDTNAYIKRQATWGKMQFSDMPIFSDERAVLEALA